MDSELLDRIRRLYSSIEQVFDRDFSKFSASHETRADSILIRQDFSAGASEADLSNAIHTTIHNVASFHDHLQKWGDRHRVSGDKIHDFLKASFAFCVIRDLWNNDKHGWPPTKGKGWSRKAPRLTNIHRACRLQTGTGENSSVTMTLGANGVPRIQSTGSGSAVVVLTGDVVDETGNKICDANELIEDAVSVCEAAVQNFVIKS
jgi:hypothetical protein